MENISGWVDLCVKGEQIILAFNDCLKSYKKLRLKGEGTRDYHYLINVPRLYVGNKYSPNRRYSVCFGMNKENNHQIVLIDLDDRQEI
ncbi:Uncharacterised protein [uncultured archaeon]|nr:Uncharacterised protein [uncultured archaeon]